MGVWDQFLAKVKEGATSLTGATTAATPDDVIKKVESAAASFKGAAELAFDLLKEPPKPKEKVDPQLRRLAEEAIDLYERTSMTALRMRAEAAAKGQPLREPAHGRR